MQDCNRDCFWQALGLYKRQSRAEAKKGGGKTKRKKKYRENQTSTSPSTSSFFNTSLQKQKRQNKESTKTRGGRTQKKTRGRLEKQTRQKQREALASQRTSTSPVSGCTAPWTDGRRAVKTTSGEPRTRREHRRTKTQTGGKTGESIKK